MPTNDEIPSLTLRVLENIQATLVEVKGEIVEMKGEIVEMKGEIVEMKDEIKILNERFDHFLGFVGRDVQDLKQRVMALEQRRP